MPLNSKTLLALLVLCLVVHAALPILPIPGGPQGVTFGYLASGTGETTYQVIQHPLPKGSTEPWSIATDSLGRAWFVQQGSNQLGMLDPVTGNITEYSIPTPNSTAISVAVDRAGNVWLTELTANRLGELRNGSANIVEFAVPGAPYKILGQTQFQSCGPTGVVPDSQGEIWIICEFSNRIEEFFPESGSFLGFDLPIYMSAPAGLVFDNLGNFYFTAADANMLGHGVISELLNGTSNGITEFAPTNETYSFTFQHPLGPLGPYENLTSSLPTPSGIALSPDGSTLWVTEHVDSSFDSYNVQSKSLVRYWTSKTDNEFGYAVSFPNGIALDKEGNVWIAEHYGNRIAEFDPASDSLTEYIVPCCGSSSAGTYTLALGMQGTVWFVEIGGNAIGELKPVNANETFSLSLGSSGLNLGSSDSANIPLTFSLSGASSPSQNVTFDVSGISRTGVLSAASSEFNPHSLQLGSAGNATSNLSIKTEGLGAGTYYLTVSATVFPRGVIYSRILKLTISSYSGLLTSAVFIGVIVSAAVIGFISFRMGRRKRTMSRRRRMRARG